MTSGDEPIERAFAGPGTDVHHERPDACLEPANQGQNSNGAEEPS
jgi:hypothetical protein